MNKTVAHAQSEVGMNHVAGALLTLALLLLLSALPVQAEIYKWVDETGQVNYTQNPPPDPQRYDTETISITPHPAAPPSATPPVTTATAAPVAAQHCGSITLPVKRLDPLTNLAMYRQAIAVWQRYIDENQRSSEGAMQKGVADRRCAIAAANGELRALSGVEQNLNSNYERVRRELEELQQSIQACDDPQQVDEALSAAACKQQYQARLTQLQTMQRALEGPKQLLAPGD